MYKFISFLLISLSFFGLNLFRTALAYGQNIPQEVEQAQKGIVKIHTSNSYGTGFFISPDTLVTNFHIVVNEKGLLPIKTFHLKTFRLSNGFKFYKKAKITGVKALSAIDDLAILEVTNYEGETLKFSDFEDTAKEVYMLGFTKDVLRIIKGETVNQNDKDHKTRSLSSLPYTKGLFPDYPGMSGGPVLDAKGNVVAIISSSEFHILRASTSKSLRILLEKSLAVSSNGEGLFRTVIEELKQLAEQGDPVAQHTLGGMYKEGIGISQDYTEAHKWIKKAAEQEVPLAKYYLHFISLHEKYKKANGWLKDKTKKGTKSCLEAFN